MPLAVAATDAISGSTQLYWLHANHMGVPHIYTNASGAAVTPPAGYSAPGFPGQSRTLNDLYYNRYRDYDPTTGRYLQADPIGLAGGASPYSYAMNSPLRYTDPTGEFVPLIATCALNPICRTGVTAGFTVLVYYASGLDKDPCGQLLYRGNGGRRYGGGGWFGGGGISVPRGGDDDDDDDPCEAQYETDIGRCTFARIKYKKAGFAQCSSSALRRKIQCKKGQPLEPLTGVERPLYRD